MANRRKVGAVTTGEIVIGVAVIGIAGYLIMNASKTPAVATPPKVVYQTYTPPPSDTSTAISEGGSVLNNLINSIFS